MSKLLILMGSDSDLPQLTPCLEVLDRFSVPYDAEVCSAHRTPEKAARLSESAESKGYQAILCAAGLAAHLGGVIAAHTVLPVIAIPMAAGPLNGVDALYASVMMPPGVPVACVGIGAAQNAGLLAIQMLGIADPNLRAQFHAYKVQMAEQVEGKNAKLQAKLREAKA